MGRFFNFSLLDLFNDPAIKLLRGGAKICMKIIASASANEDNEKITTPELAELLHGAQTGNSNAQVLLSVHYAENGNFEMATYWLKKSADQGNEHALEIVDMLQSE